MSPRHLLPSTLAFAAALAALTAGPSAARADEWKRPRGGYVPIEPAPVNTAAGGEISRIIYLNRCADGCDITRSDTNNARENTSSIPDTSINEVSTVAPFAGSEKYWNDLVACITEVYAPYDVEIVTEDPGEVAYHEAIVAGDPSDLNLPADVGGKANLSCAMPLNNVISFSFANIYPESRMFELCATVAQESAHAFGLEHEVDCSDPMTYESGCGQKFFRNTSFHCGVTTDLPENCFCGGTLQNSHQKLFNAFGEGTLPPPPTLSIALPDEGDVIPAGEDFAIYAFAADKRGVFRVEFYLNGWLWETLEGHEDEALNDDQPYIYTVPESVPDGVIEIEVRASNDLGPTSTSTVTITKGEPCESASTCLGGQSCDDGACAWPPPTAEIGEACDIDQECLSTVCATTTAGKICSQECEALITGSCPDGFVCESNDVCAPATEEGGCCSVGDAGGPPVGQIALFLLVVAGVLARRPRHTPRRAAKR
jgi:MYXO-CTERM domain-containing protein